MTYQTAKYEVAEYYDEGHSATWNMGAIDIRQSRKMVEDGAIVDIDTTTKKAFVSYHSSWPNFIPALYVDGKFINS